jgi:hypothetical protein
MIDIEEGWLLAKICLSKVSSRVTSRSAIVQPGMVSRVVLVGFKAKVWID